MLSLLLLLVVSATASSAAAVAAVAASGAPPSGAPVTVCPAGYNTINGTDDCFKLYGVSMAYAAAESVCNQDGGHLSSIHSAQERRDLNDIIGAASPLIGIKCSSVSSCTWSDGTPMDYQNFIYGQPTLEYGSCAHLFADDDKFYSWNCATPMNTFLCRLAASTDIDCSPGYSPLGTQCAVVKTVPRTGDEAENECALEGGHLASIHDLTSNIFLTNMLFDANLTQNVHIGVRYTKNYGYYWTDGSFFDYSNWAFPEFPDTHFGVCGELLVTDEFGVAGQWTNIPCDTKLPYVCLKNEGVSPTYAPISCPNIQYFEDYGTVYSPGFPLTVPTKTRCEYLLAGDLGTKIAVSFPFFNIDDNSANTKLTIYDGMSVATPMAVLTGEQSGRMFYSTQNIVKLVFETNAYTSGEGWEASFYTINPATTTTTARPTTTNLPAWTTIPQTVYPPTTTFYAAPSTAISSSCPSQTLYADTQVDSPGFPLGYPRNANCWYFLSGQPGKRLLLDFEYLDTKKNIDYVSIRDGPFTYSNEIGRVSGSTLGNTVRWVSTSNYFTLQFVSDNTKGGTGWTATLDSVS